MLVQVGSPFFSKYRLLCFFRWWAKQEQLSKKRISSIVLGLRNGWRSRHVRIRGDSLLADQ